MFEQSNLLSFESAAAEAEAAKGEAHHPTFRSSGEYAETGAAKEFVLVSGQEEMGQPYFVQHND